MGRYSRMNIYTENITHELLLNSLFGFVEKIKSVDSVALFGISGLYNFGCEAILRGTVRILRKCNPTVRITYCSRCADADAAVISDLQINVIQIKHRPRLYERAINYGLSLLGIPIRIPFDDYNLIASSGDLLISIGGDIYTIPQRAQSSMKYKAHSPLVQFGEWALKQGKEIVIWGASIGPFGQKPRNIGYFRNHLEKVGWIYCREPFTLTYLSSLGLGNMSMFPDPAFFVDTNKIEWVYHGCVAVNLSDYSFSEFYSVSDELIRSIADLLVKLQHTTRRKIVLVPHVIPTNASSDNDLQFLSRIFAFISEKERQEFVLYHPQGGFRDVKRVLGSCDLVIASRMHCAINAVSEGVPTIFLSYSSKAKGMAVLLYGNDDWSMSMDQIFESLVSRAEAMLSCSEDIRQTIHRKMAVFNRLIDQL